MKKIFLILGLLIGCIILFGCRSVQKDNKLVAIGKVDLVSFCEDSCPLSLKLITSDIINEIKVLSTDATENYTYIVEQPKYVSLIETNQKANLYLINFEFSKPTEMTKVSLQLDKEVYDFNIGKFKCVPYEKIVSTIVKEEEEHFQIIQAVPLEKAETYIYPTQISLYFKNTSSENIYINNISIADKSDKYNVKVLKAIQSADYLIPGENNNYAFVYYDTTDLTTMHTSSIIRIYYRYANENYCRYIRIDCGYTDELVRSVILENPIYRSTLSLGVVREQIRK